MAAKSPLAQPANTASAGKPKRKPNATAWKPGQSGNPRGSPKRGESWSELISRIGDMTPREAAEFCAGELATQLRSADKGVTMKTAVVMRVYASLLFEPSPGMLNAFMDRVEGTPKQTLGVEGAKGGAIETVLRVVYDDPKPRSTPTDAAPKAK